MTETVNVKVVDTELYGKASYGTKKTWHKYMFNPLTFHFMAWWEKITGTQRLGFELSL